MQKLILVFLVATLPFASIKAQQIPCVDAVNAVSNDTLLSFMRILTGLDSVAINGNKVLIESRFRDSIGNLQTEQYLIQSCTEYGYQIQDIPFSATGRNIIAFKPGTLNDKKAFIISGHFDAVRNTKGADDNASGTAAVLEAARVLKDIAFPYTIIFAFWDEEEQGLIGSRNFAPDGPLGYWDVAFMMNLDMIAWDNNNDSLAMIHTKPIGNSIAYADSLAAICTQYQIPLKPFIRNPGEEATDHQAFWLKGTTAIGLTEDYDFDFNPHWHRPSDSLANCHLPYFYRMTRLAIAGICEFTLRNRSVAVTEFLLAKTRVNVWPNPSKKELHIHHDEDLAIYKWRIYNLQGLLVSQGNDYTQIDVEGLLPGMYYVELDWANNQLTRLKWVKE